MKYFVAFISSIISALTVYVSLGALSAAFLPVWMDYSLPRVLIIVFAGIYAGVTTYKTVLRKLDDAT